MSDLMMSDFKLRTPGIHFSQLTIHAAAHSVRSDFTGFAIAAFIAWKLTVINAINKAVIPAKANTHHSITVLYS